MDDKEFDKIMDKYKSTTIRGKEFDLQKVDYEKFAKEKKIKMTRHIALIATSLLLIVLIVSVIVFPMVFRQKEEEILNYYSDNGDLKFEKTEDLQELEEEGLKFKLPKMDGEVTYQLIERVKDDIIIGLQIDYLIYDETFDDITIYTMKKNHLLLIMEEYKYFQDTITWNDNSVKYKTVFNEQWYCYETKIYFYDGKYDYYIDLNYYAELGINEILDKLYR